MRARRYISAGSILSQYKVDCERLGEEITGPVARALTDAARSCRRGQGPARRALALDLFKIHTLTGAAAPLHAEGPMCPRNCLVVAGWWLLRETEVANLRLKDVSLELDGVPVASLTLPVSKADQEAQGTTRKHGCACMGRPP